MNCAKKAIFDFSTVSEVPKFVGMWDVESAGDEWTSNNAFKYSFSLYGRKIEHFHFEAGEFCAGKETGHYTNDQEDIYCDNDSMGGGWV